MERRKVISSLPNKGVIDHAAPMLCVSSLEKDKQTKLQRRLTLQVPPGFPAVTFVQ